MEIPHYEMLIREIAKAAAPDQVIEDLRIYTNWVLVKTGKWSLSTIFRGMPGLTDPAGMDSWMGDWLHKPGLESSIELLSSTETLRRAVGMACLKSLHPEPQTIIHGNAIDMVKNAAAHVPTCFVGYFKEGAEWREMGWPVHIVELFPRPGDIHWNDADEVLSRAQIVLMSGLTIVNETLQAVIRRTPDAKIRVMMGPTVPPSPALFECGLDLIGVTLVQNMELMARYAELGGGSISHSPLGALERINMVKDISAFKKKLLSLGAVNKEIGESDVA
ncbi:hypothetical protein KHC33_14355 [Methanospirillum sp. J.3.6.1-F.2.7.3]|uniref:DUF364 domain-containing protein n=1 Tax=Methanospirillum purgamenti TaxID=2834276 RepID=A0A8E7AW76_9EURY|nr:MULTISPECIES: DUF364 domain-containing protein [Methanospirillum]MDX8548791.1 DUF364 domain-containing protein [Methanospirillum hungatei]QVV88490.1 hypothetical protein KHC33_14355 [Methanospirillum sp. J.3.6.1-F.2.7.3]